MQLRVKSDVSSIAYRNICNQLEVVTHRSSSVYIYFATILLNGWQGKQVIVVICNVLLLINIYQ